MADKSVAIRLSVKDAEQVRATLERLGKDGDAAIRKIDRAARDASAGGLSRIGSAVDRLEANARRIGAAIGIVGAGALVTLTRNAIDAAGGLGELAEQLGTNTDSLQVYQFAATQVGVSNAELETSISRLTRSIGEAVEGNAEYIGAFERAGVKLLDFNGKVRSTDAVIADLADGLKAIEDPAQRASIAADLFGRAGQRLLPLLTQGSAGLREFEAEARRLGLVWSAEQIARADKLGDALAALEFEARKLAQTFALDGGLLEGLQALVDFLNGKEITGDGRLAQFIKNTAGDIERLKAVVEWFTGGDKSKNAGPGWFERNIATAPWESGSPEERAWRAQQDADKRWADIRHRYLAGGGTNGQFSERFMRDYAAAEQRAALIDYSVDEFAAGRGADLVFPSAAAGGASNPATAAQIAAREREAEAIRKVTDELARQADQFGRSGEARAAYDALAKAGIKTSDEEIAAARELLRTNPELASDREKAIVQIADQAAQNHRKTEAEKAGIQAQKEAEQQQKRLTEQQAKASQALDEMLAELQEEQHQLGLSERERFIRQKGLEAEKIAIEAGIDPQDARIARIKEEAGATYDLNKAVEQAKKSREEFEREAERQAEAQRELLLEPWREAWRSIQQLGVDALEQLFDGGLRKASDFWKAFLDIAKKALLQLAAAEITVAIQGVFGVGAGGTGGIGGLLGSLFGGGSPIAGTQNLPSNGGLGGGGIGSLFGQGSIGSFLARPLHSFGIGSPGLDPTGASAYLGLAESGGIGGFLGDLSLGQGLGALGGLAGGIAGLATGNYVGGITSLLGAGLSLIPGVGQVLGPIVAIAGGLLGGLLGGPKKPPRKSLQLLTTGGDTAGFERGGATAITPFGTLGYDRLGTNQQFVSTEYSANLIEAIAEIDRAIAELLTGEQIAQVSAALRSAQTVQNNYRNNPDREAFDSAKDRLETMLRALYGGSIATKGLAGIARSDENIEELANRAGNIIQLKNAIADFGKETTVAEEAVRQLNKEFADMSAKAEDWGFSDADVAKIEQERRRQISKLATDFNDGVALALLGMEDPYAAALQQLEKDQAKRLAEAQYLNTVSDVLVDINKLEELFGKERVALQKQALEAAGESWDDFVKRFLFGDLSQRSNREQYELALAEFADVRSRAEAAYANDNLDPALAAEFQREAVLALQWSRTYQASSLVTAQLAADIERLARLFGDLGEVPGMATGGSLGPGLVRVGERGAEIIRLFQPARVYSREASDGMLGGFDLAGLRAALRETALEQIHQNADGQGMIVALLRTLVEEIRAEARDRRLREPTPRVARRRGAHGESR
ncbi:MAG: hypothetical protein AB7R90_19480 [Reyranellaceae bacterium]